MTSIFGDHYRANLERVKSADISLKRNSDTREENSSDFIKVLGDLETKREKARRSQALSEENKSPERALLENIRSESSLTNLEPIEKQHITEGLSKPDQSTVRPENAVKNDAAKLAPGVKGTDSNVNIAPPKPPVLIAQEPPPRAPLLLSARQVSAAYSGQQQAKTAENVIPEPRLPDLDSDTGAVKRLVQLAGRFHGVDPQLSLAVAYAESALKPDAVSKDGHKSKGVFQLLDTTARDMMKLVGLDEESYDPFNPSLNAFLGTRYLRCLHEIFSEPTDLGWDLKTVAAGSAAHLEKLAVAAFNAGEGNVALAQAKAKEKGKDPSDYFAIEPYLPPSTRQYVARVSNLKGDVDALNLFEQNA